MREKGDVLIVILVLVVVLIGLGVAAYFFLLPLNEVKVVPVSSTNTPTLVSTEQPTSGQIDETANWKTYINSEINFKTIYPANWALEEIPQKTGDEYKGVYLKGKEGYVKILWGAGFGGMCSHEYEDVPIKTGTLKACHDVGEDGTEGWGGFGKKIDGIGFYANAVVNAPYKENRGVVLKVISNFEFTDT